tara:strand:+ start:296 stop:730 length:435 start_codon:yes stop_codon:yes gene_type:complete
MANEPISKSNRERLKELYHQYNLHKDEDIFRHKKFGYVMITKSGIEKIMAQDQINVTFVPEKIFEDQDGNCKGCIVKATAMKNDVKIETFGTATKDNCQSTYYMEMAEKRSKARCVLQLTAFSSLGVFSDVEADEWNINHKSNA